MHMASFYKEADESERKTFAPFIANTVERNGGGCFMKTIHFVDRSYYHVSFNPFDGIYEEIDVLTEEEFAEYVLGKK